MDSSATYNPWNVVIPCNLNSVQGPVFQNMKKRRSSSLHQSGAMYIMIPQTCLVFTQDTGFDRKQIETRLIHYDGTANSGCS